MSFRAIGCLLGTALVLAGCTGSSDDSGTPDPGVQFQILGDDMSARLQNVYVQIGSVGTAGLTVTVNGTALASTGGGQYFGGLPAAVPTGGAVQLIVTDGTHTATGNTVVPEAPVITSVTVASPGAPVVITWTSATAPDSFTVSLNYHLPGDVAAAVSSTVRGSVRQVSLPQTSIPAGGVVFSVGLEAMMNGVFTGAAASGSAMNLRAEPPSYPFTVP